jgi:PAS domain S-box-containing protein
MYFVWMLAALAALFNLSRTSDYFMRSRIYSSPITLITFDFLVVCGIVFCAGTIITPFSAYFMIPIIIAAYAYRLKGVIIVMLIQLVATFIILATDHLTPIVLNDKVQLLLTVSVTVSTGLFIERLTRIHRKETDKILRVSNDNEAQRKRLEALVNSVNDGIFVVNEHGQVINYNAAAAELSTKKGELSNSLLMDVLKLYPHTNLSHEPVDLLKSRQAQHRRDLSVKNTEGVVTDLDISVQPVRMEGAKVTEYIVLCRDITRERNIDEQRSTFIAVASHELRTPITIMEAALSTAIAAGKDLSEPLQMVLKQAHDNSIYLGTIVRDLTILAQASNDNIPIQLKKIDSESLVSQLVHEFKAQAEQKGLRLKSDIQGNIPQILSTETHIREIVQNYILNALKYTHEGTITIRLKAARNGGVQFAVSDEGIGIAEKDRQQLFKKFFRSEDYRTQEVGGTGLGLYLCSEIAQRINGKVWCESEINKGSTFYLEIPPVSYLGRDQKEVVKTEVANLVDDI